MANITQEESLIILANKDNYVKEKSEENPSQATEGDAGNEIGRIGMNKIFVGGLPSNINEEEFKNYFKKFGRVTDGVIILDESNGKSRGFGFIIFESEEVMNNVLKQNYHKLNNRYVEVKKALPKNKINTGPINNTGTECYRGNAIYGYYYYYDPYYYGNLYFEGYNGIGLHTSMLNEFYNNTPWSHGNGAYYDPYRPRVQHDYRQLPNSASSFQIFSRASIE